jgi:hypothetical protein
MDIKEIMKINVDTLRQTQYEALKNHVIDILDKIKFLIKDDDFNTIEKFLEYSPACDGYVEDNNFIDFSYNDEYPLGIKEVIEELKSFYK